MSGTTLLAGPSTFNGIPTFNAASAFNNDATFFANINLSGTINGTGAFNLYQGTLTTANISANYYIGNGALLTGISVGTTYSNANVVTLLAAFGSNTVSTTGNITSGNVLTGGLISSTGNISTAGQISAAANVTTGGSSYVIVTNTTNDNVPYLSGISPDAIYRTGVTTNSNAQTSNANGTSTS